MLPLLLDDRSGSHKSTFSPPPHLDIHSPPPAVISVTPHQGDCVVFAELQRHGCTRKWTESAYPPPDDLCSVLYILRLVGTGLARPGRYKDRISPEGFQTDKAVVSRLLAEDLTQRRMTQRSDTTKPLKSCRTQCREALAGALVN